MVSSVNIFPTAPKILKSVHVDPLRTDSIGKSAAFNAEDIRQLVHQVVFTINRMEGTKSIANLAKSISMEDLEEAVRQGVPEYIGVKAAALQIRPQAIYTRNLMQNLKKPTVGEYLFHCWDSFVLAAESFLRGLGLIDFFQPVPNGELAETKGQQMVMLTTLFTTLVTALIPALGPLHGMAAVGGFFFALILMAATHPSWKPMPQYLPRVENWTDKYRKGILDVQEGRREELDLIVDRLTSGGGQVLLIGKAGVGKTELAKSLVLAIERGEYPELKNKHVYYVNTADLLGSNEWLYHWQSILSYLSEEFGRHRANIILVLDQIHMACSSDAKSLIADQLKTMLDRPKEHFPRVIGITTEEEYLRDIHPKHANFSSRFSRVSIADMTKEETLHILRKTIETRHPEILLEPGALEAIFDKAKELAGKEAAMPKEALYLLSKCVQKASERQRSPLEIRRERLRSSIAKHYCERALEQGDWLKSTTIGSIELLEKELSDVEKALQEEKNKIARLFERRLLLLDLKKMMFDLSVKIPKGAPERDQKAFLLLSHFLIPMLEKELKSEAHGLGVFVGIDKKLIDVAALEEIHLKTRRKI